MIYKNPLLAATVLLLAFTACKNKNDDKVPVIIQDEVLHTIFTNKYQGILPCGDCPGIETTLALAPDSTVSKMIFYQDKSKQPALLLGSWKRKDSVFEINLDGSKEFYKINTDSLMARVGSDLREVKGKLAQEYLLHLKQPTDWSQAEGKYLLGDSLSVQYKQFNLEKIKENDYKLTHTTISPLDTCTFIARGLISRTTNELIFPMKTINKELNGDLKIYFTEQFAHFQIDDAIETSEQAFCDNQTVNLNGNYKKQIENTIAPTLEEKTENE